MNNKEEKGPPYVFKNETPDPSFGITSPIMLDRLTTSGALTITNNGSDITGTIDVALNHLATGVTLINATDTYQL